MKYKKISNKVLIVFFLFILVYSVFFIFFQNNSFSRTNFTKLNYNSYKNENVNFINNVVENISLQNFKVDFCPSKKCFEDFSNILNISNESINCAFYNFEENNLFNLLVKKLNDGVKINIITDDNLNKNYFYKFESLKKKYENFNFKTDKNRLTKYDNLMHDKFCIIDKKFVITGSTNPTYNGFFRNNNNLLIIKSKYLSEDYNLEFNQMMNGYFGYNKKNVIKYENITLNIFNNSKNSSILRLKISVYFCPENNCEYQILKTLNGSKKKIDFASFVFTNNKISTLLFNLKNKKSIKIKGLLEKKFIKTTGSQYDFLKDFLGNDLHLDKNKYIMHDKYFIIDNDTIITGSANPTKSGMFYNDENILIIKGNYTNYLFRQNFNKIFNVSY